MFHEILKPKRLYYTLTLQPLVSFSTVPDIFLHKSIFESATMPATGQIMPPSRVGKWSTMIWNECSQRTSGNTNTDRTNKIMLANSLSKIKRTSKQQQWQQPQAIPSRYSQNAEYTEPRKLTKINNK